MRQGRLQDLGSIIKLPKTTGATTLEDLAQYKATLLNGCTKDIQNTLLTLACIKISTDMFIRSQIGSTVKSLRTHADVEVASIAKRLLARWRSELQIRARLQVRKGARPAAPRQQPQQPLATASST